MPINHETPKDPNDHPNPHDEPSKLPPKETPKHKPHPNQDNPFDVEQGI